MSMITTFVDRVNTALKQPDLRKKIIFTLIMFLVARVGTYIPAPGIDMKAFTDQASKGSIFDFINMFSGGGFKRFSIFALGIMPYINASIIFQLLAAVYPPLEEKKKEGEKGQQEVVQWTRYLTIVIGAIQAAGLAIYISTQSVVRMESSLLFIINTVVILTAGTVFLMWVGEQISIYGLGNGISLIIFINIVAEMPSGALVLMKKFLETNINIGLIKVFLICLLIIALIGAIVIFQLAIRRIPILYAGRNLQGKNSIASKTFLPLKVNTAGVMPIIFASVLMMIPDGFLRLLAVLSPTKTAPVMLTKLLGHGGALYVIILAALVFFFTFFYTAMVFDPMKVADNLKKSGGTIPGIRPGAETVNYLDRVVTNITWGGAIFLTLLAVLPVLLTQVLNIPLYIGGTGLLIVVGVALDTVQQVDAHLVMRNYEGFIS
ncbi:MAG: preprotein translocase subunit SecY [Fusobacteria bacterium]|jgi:preprotein translocase subunit SecY|nr:preprotein translocase subunit SecY [Fusobacteriota bacterium]